MVFSGVLAGVGGWKCRSSCSKELKHIDESGVAAMVDESQLQLEEKDEFNEWLARGGVRAWLAVA